MTSLWPVVVAHLWVVDVTCFLGGCVVGWVLGYHAGRGDRDREGGP